MERKGLRYRINQITEDQGSWWIYKSVLIRHSLIRIFSGWRTKFMGFIKGIQIGENCEFYGVPYFYRNPKSTISIGNNCTLRSDRITNLIGLNHKCILATRTPGASITIGKNSGMSGVSLVAFKEIKIGDNVLIGANSTIVDGDGHFDLGKTEPKSVVINDNVWIGANCTILKGIEIGKNSIIGANSLVITNIPDNVIAIGNPCRVISNISK